MTFAEKLAAKTAELKELNEKMMKGDIEAAAKAAEVQKEMDDLDQAIKAAEAVEAKLAALGTSNTGKPEVSAKAAKTLGDHFVQTFKKAAPAKGQRFDLVAPEFKAASNIFTDHSIEEFPMGSITQDYSVVEGARMALQVRDLFDAQTLSTAAYSYFTEGAIGTGFSTDGIEESAEKTALSYEPYKGNVAFLVKIAGYIKESAEFISDYPFLASAINGRLIYDLRAAVQAYLVGELLGAGITADTESWTAETTAAGLADLVLGAIMDVQADSGRAADAIIMNPTDWYSLRIGKNGSGDYYGGGYFQDGRTPTLWGLPVAITASVTAGTIVVGAFKRGATVLSNGGIQVEATNTNEDDFIKNLMTIRAEERLALAVRVPTAFKALIKSNGSV